MSDLPQKILTKIVRHYSDGSVEEETFPERKGILVVGVGHHEFFLRAMKELDELHGLIVVNGENNQAVTFDGDGNASVFPLKEHIDLDPIKAMYHEPKKKFRNEESKRQRSRGKYVR